MNGEGKLQVLVIILCLALTIFGACKEREKQQALEYQKITSWRTIE